MAWVSIAGMSVASAFSICVASLAALALAKGLASEVFFFPDPAVIGGSFENILQGALGIIPVIMLAFICHFNLHPVVRGMSTNQIACLC